MVLRGLFSSLLVFVFQLFQIALSAFDVLAYFVMGQFMLLMA